MGVLICVICVFLTKGDPSVIKANEKKKKKSKCNNGERKEEEEIQV
jgi:hypothetical protein